MYHEHSFIPFSVYPTSELGYDNWLTSKCKKCGILLKYNTDIETEVHYGAIHLFKSPKTGEFDDLCVCWVEGEYNKPHYKTISKSDYESYKGEKFSDGSPYVSYFKITFDHPVDNFRINYVEDDGTKKKAGDAIYKNVEVAADSPLYFAICLNESDVLDTRGFYYTNKDGNKKYYSLHVSGRDGSVLMSEY